MEFFVAIIFMAIVCALIGYFIDGVRGTVLGGSLGIIGLIISAILHGRDAS